LLGNEDDDYYEERGDHCISLYKNAVDDLVRRSDAEFWRDRQEDLMEECQQIMKENVVDDLTEKSVVED
jgi:hypothetical protein